MKTNQGKVQKTPIKDGFCFTHTYILKKPSFLFFFPSDGRKLSNKSTVKKNEEKTITSHFSATHTHIKPSLMYFSFFAPFP